MPFIGQKVLIPMICVILAGAILETAQADWDGSIQCTYQFGKASDDQGNRTGPQTDSSGNPDINLGRWGIWPSCKSLGIQIFDAIKNGQKSCSHGILAVLKFNNKNLAQSRDQFETCPCPDCVLGTETIHKLVDDSTEYLKPLSGGYIDLDLTSTQKVVTRYIREYDNLLTQVQKSGCDEGQVNTMKDYLTNAQAELKRLSAQIESIRQSAIKGKSKWDRIDAMGSGGAAMSDAQSEVYYKKLQQSSDPLEKTVGDLIATSRDAKSPDRKKAADQLQQAINTFYASEYFTGPFAMDGIVAKRTITATRKLLEDPKARQDFAKALNDAGVDSSTSLPASPASPASPTPPGSDGPPAIQYGGT